MVNLKNIEYNLKPLKGILNKFKAYDFTALEDTALMNETDRLREQAVQGKDEEILLPETFALVSEAVKRTLGLTPHDNQLMAAAAMARGDIIELATGEGKTLAAIFTATLKALSREGVHVLTFNDYLAKRDAEWMKPVYRILGLSVSHIAEGMTAAERKLAYAADITYVTAKEAGFDFLRGFLAFEPDKVVQRPFHFAVIDEADSILIDEARIPLVIAGDEPSMIEIEKTIFAAVAGMERGLHFDTDENDGNIYLEDAGIAFIETALGIKDLYDEKNICILAKVNVILQAEFMLKRDVDYIVKEGRILLVDGFTGRVAKNRQWSDGLQAAVELKEGLTPKMQGRIMNRISLQSFLRLYPSFCGMTGTACTAAMELMKFYDRSVTVIPPNEPCVRIDQPDVIFATKEAKFRAVADEVIKSYRAGRPVLVGTADIEESEQLADLLKGEIPGLNVLNAKNDAEEAKIIARAGVLGAVTISTNMAGRGVDIQLGGQNSIEYERICSLGGLYIIGTSRYASLRVDEQLRGRAGRQGDPGESRFFISLEDDLVVKYGLKDRIPEKYRSPSRDVPLTNRAFARAIQYTQKYMEAQTFDAKTTLFKYAQLVEEQRKIVHQKRMAILFGRTTLSVFRKEKPDTYNSLLGMVAKEEFLRAQRQIELFVLNQCWSDHLLFVESLSDEIFMRGKVHGDPFMNYNKRLIEGFELFQENVRRSVLEIFESVSVNDGKIDLDQMGIVGPTSTRTYLVHDGTEDECMMGIIGDLVVGPRLMLDFLFDRMKRKNK